MKQGKKELKKSNKKLITGVIKNKMTYLIILMYLCVSQKTVHADETSSIAGSTFGKGLIKLLGDVSAFLLVLSPIVGGLFAVYFFIRKNAADEQDQKQWNKRLIITGVCVVGAVLVSSMIQVITGYFK
ncbi:Mbov_0395 family pilin-like conjugal transfer protein [Anaeromicropila herbilytica]|uniref:Uncharacterized protein n=1 Tax=Anaeromicropila herbilytica TaxID=2785025 RepID=A0A7R7IC46_9FIRM|nr:hypothetical protein [Anaeromicropila herbilytica]BCN29524.1 hypothetical protein bsdtb5_08190 [Anaeromicropila herbilytica]